MLRTVIEAVRNGWIVTHYESKSPEDQSLSVFAREHPVAMIQDVILNLGVQDHVYATPAIELPELQVVTPPSVPGVEEVCWNLDLILTDGGFRTDPSLARMEYYVDRWRKQLALARVKSRPKQQESAS